MSLTAITARGDTRSMGRAHGEGVAEQIHGTIRVYEGAAAAKGGDLFGATDRLGPYIDASKKKWPDLVDEVEGLAEGAGIDIEAAWLLNCMEEVWPFEACVTMSSGSLLMHAEQWSAGHEHLALVHAEPDPGPAFVSPTCVGFLPAVGLNASGFAQGIDSLTAPGDRVGVPRVLISRRALGAASLDKAVEAAAVPGRAGGYSHVLKSDARAVFVETTANEAEILLESRGAHTNHYLSRGLVKRGDEPSNGSRKRLERAHQLLAESQPTTLEEGMKLLSDHGDGGPSTCLHGREGDPMSSATVFGMVCDVTSGRMLVSDGHPCEGRWHETAVPGFRAEEATHVG